MAKVLIVVDMQNDFLLPGGKLTISSKIEDSTKKLREDAAKFVKAFDGDIIFTRDVHEENSCEFEMYPPHCIKCTEGADIVNELIEFASQKRCDIVDKGNFSKGINFDPYLQSESIPLFTVFGVCTHISVHDVVSELVNSFKVNRNKIPDVTVYKDLCGDFDPQMADFGLKRLQNLYGVNVV